MKTIITIGREFGSGGHLIGKLLAEDLKIPFYDKELLDQAAKHSGLAKEIFENQDEKPTSSFLYSLVMDTYSLGYSSGTFHELPLNHKIFLAQFDTIRNIAAKGPCVIVGRCADYVLRDEKNVVSVFVKADMEDRKARAVKYYNVDPTKAEDVIRKADKQRASYYDYYATATWGAVDNYDLCVDTGAVGVDGAVDVLAQFVELQEKFRQEKQ